MDFRSFTIIFIEPGAAVYTKASHKTSFIPVKKFNSTHPTVHSMFVWTVASLN